jgi:hypothetical protein
MKQSWKTKKLKTELNRLFTFLDKNYNINWGGCCWLTYCLAYNFERLSIPYSLVIYDTEGDPEEAYNNIIGRWTSFPTGDETASHYTLKAKGLGVLNKSKGEPFILINDVDSDDIRWIYDKGSWNECYNSRLNDEIKNLVDTVFKIYEKEICKTIETD